LIVDRSTKCDNPNCGNVITSSGWKFAAVTETPNGELIFCCSNCRVQAGYGGTGRICSVIPEGSPIPNSESHTSGGYFASTFSSKERIITFLLAVFSIILCFSGKGNFSRGRRSGALTHGSGVYWDEMLTPLIIAIVCFMLLFYSSNNRTVLRWIFLIAGIFSSLFFVAQGAQVSVIFILSFICCLASIILAKKYHK